MNNVLFSKDEIRQIFGSEKAADVFGVSIDSRTIKNGDIFIAIPGKNFDGHNFIKQAIDNGAALVLASNSVKCDVDQTYLEKIIFVDNTINSLKKMAEFSRSRLKPYGKLIAITGSVGKTTTKDMLAFLLSKQKKTFASVKNFNSQIGLPICLCLVPKDSDFVVVELGMSNYGQISELVRIAKPNVSMLTEIAENHVGFFENMCDIAKEKSNIIKHGQEFCIIPKHSKYYNIFEKRALSEDVNSVAFGDKDSCCTLISKEYFDDCVEVTFELYREKFRARLNSFKDSFVYSFLECIACIKSLNLSVQKALDAIASFSPPDGRGNLIKMSNGSVLIDDTYNASPASIKDGLGSLRFFHQKNKIAVLGDIGELGEQAICLHESIADSIVSSDATCVVLIGKYMSHLYNKLISCSDSKKNVLWFENLESSFSFFRQKRENCVFYLKASRFMAFEKLVSYIKEIYNVI